MNQFMTLEEFLVGAVFIETPTDIIRQACEEYDRSEYPFPPGTASQHQRDQDWSRLANQVVGAETF